MVRSILADITIAVNIITVLHETQNPCCVYDAMTEYGEESRFGWRRFAYSHALTLHALLPTLQPVWGAVFSRTTEVADLFTPELLARDNIYAERAICCRSSVRPSVTRVNQSKTVEVRIMQLSPQSSLVFSAPSLFDAPTSRNRIRIYLIFLETRVIVLHFAADSMGLSSFKFLQWAPKDASCCNTVRIGRSKSSKVDDFGTDRKRICDFLLVRHNNLGNILHCFWDTATYWLKIAYFSYCSLIRRPRSLWRSLWSFAVKLTILYASISRKRFSRYDQSYY